jgi:CheY-like chemotaxis protein
MINTPATTRTILIVDDEEMVLTLGRVILERKGYNVRVALSGAQALELCRESEVRPDCIIVDYTMPDMNGRETLLAIRKILPAVPALISSGYSDDEIAEEIAGISVSGMIHKPYRQESLLAAIEAAFASADQGTFRL